MIERTTVRLPAELLSRAKRKAAAEGRTLTALNEDGLRMVVTESRKTPPAKRVLPRVSTATGGPAPGTEGMTYSECQEIEDLEYIERMKHFK